VIPIESIHAQHAPGAKCIRSIEVGAMVSRHVDAMYPGARDLRGSKCERDEGNGGFKA